MRSLLYSVAVLAATVQLAAAECRGHGLCKEHDQCKCEPNYFGADCSQRVCPHDFAFTDFPAGDLNHDGERQGKSYVKMDLTMGSATGTAAAYELFPTDKTKGLFEAQKDEAHFYMECSGKGDCDRSSGECKCVAGYTGSSCQRTSCPNECSGRGLCRTLKEIASGALSRRAIGGEAGNLKLSGVRNGFDYSLWDGDKHQMCVCDAGFEGIDCSLRSCPRGDDPLTPGQERWCGGKTCSYEVQRFKLSAAPSTTYKFSFTDNRNQTLVAYFTVDTSIGVPGYVADPSKALPGPTTNAGIIMNALRAIPGGQLQLAEVRALGANQGTDGDLVRTFDVTFTGMAGNQYLMTLVVQSGSGQVETAPAEITTGNKEDIECSGRGICEKSSGLCGCFSGYFGVACEYQNALTAGSSSMASGVIGGMGYGVSAAA